MVTMTTTRVCARFIRFVSSKRSSARWSLFTIASAVDSSADVALDGEGRVSVAELLGDDGGVELEVEEHPARGDVPEIVDGPLGSSGPAPSLALLAVSRGTTQWSGHRPTGCVGRFDPDLLE